MMNEIVPMILKEEKKKKTFISQLYINGKHFPSIFHSWENALYTKAKDLLDVFHVWGLFFLHFIYFGCWNNKS